MKAMLPSANVREVQGFLGIHSYYRCCIPNFSETTTPLIILTKKFAKFVWSEECQVAFEFLKTSLTTVPILGYHDVNKPYILYTDASENCIGACLCQPCDKGEGTEAGMTNEQPLYFLSHKFSPTQTRWPTIEKECYAIYYALEKLDHFLHNAGSLLGQTISPYNIY